MTDIRLDQRDVECLIDVTRRCAQAGDSDPKLPDLVEAAARLVPCDVAFWTWYSIHAEMEEHALVNASGHRDVVRAPVDPWLEHLP